MNDYAELLRKLVPGSVVSVPPSKEGLNEVLAEFITKRKTLGVYFTITQPHNKVMDWLRERSIDPTSLFFLDMVGKETIMKEDNLFVFRDPSDLTEISVVITEVLENAEIEFLVIDGLGGLETYVDAGSVKRFLHALIAYTKKLNKILVIAPSGTESKEVAAFISQVSEYQQH